MQNSYQESQKDIKDVAQYKPKASHEAVFITSIKKAEKIAMALYMVTDLIEQNDPLKHRIRECSVELIKEARGFSSAFSGDIYFSVSKAINKSWELVSLLDVATSVGFISDMNSRILRSVLIEFISSLRDKQRREGFSKIEEMKIGESLSDQITLSKSLFDVKEEEKEEPKGQTIRETKMSFIKPNQTKAIPNPTPFKTSISAPKDKSPRREKILEIIKEKGEVGVADITGSFPDVSSKTIQRELTSLVEENVLKRVGEKRWSRYFIQ